MFMLFIITVAINILSVFVVEDNEQIRVCVVNGQRPHLSVITGPEPLRSRVVDLIKRCWHKRPDKRPTFAGIYHMSYCFSR